jgi:hypothetical protein
VNLEELGAAMFLSDAVDEIREKLVKHRLAPRKYLWQTILKEIAKTSSFNGAYAQIIERMIEEFLKPLDDATIISLWSETEVGMSKEHEDNLYIIAGLRMDLEVELLEKVTDVAYYEATGKRPKRPSIFDHDPESDWD